MPYVIAAVLVIATLVIAGLCYVWMQSTRASQRRVEAQNQRIVELLEEQSGLLKKISER
jgi:archaellum component FlaF (FlaF/FlaG flagellin family)